VTERSIPVFAWGSTYASYTLFIMGPEKFGGFGDVSAKARTQAEATGRNIEDIVDEVRSLCPGSVGTETFCSFSYIIYQMAAWWMWLDCPQCTTMNGFPRGYGPQPPTQSVLKVLNFHQRTLIPGFDQNQLFISAYM
jgi:hypothetical protein